MATLLHPATDAEILATFDVMHHLRPALTRETYVARIRQVMASDNFRLTAVVEDGVVRERAHAFYFREGLAADAFHFRVKV